LKIYWMIKQLSSSVGGGVERAHLDTADTGTISVSGESDVARLSPGGSPGVLDNVEILTVLGTVADSEDSVVESGSARC